MNNKMKEVNPGCDPTEADCGNNERWFVFNLTDGIEAHPYPMTLATAVDFMKVFHHAFRRQGYYKTSRGERIPPEHVQLVLLPVEDTPRLAHIISELLAECRRRRRQGEAA